MSDATGHTRAATSRPIALVYRGPASRPEGCAEAVAELLSQHHHGFDVRYVGPRERLGLRDEVLATATVYAQPGGGTLRAGYRAMKKHREQIRRFVSSGGRYLGFCLGGYLAGATPGFALLPGDTDQYITTADATVTTTGDTVVDVWWGNRTRRVFFQDGPVFHLERPVQTGSGDRDLTVLARYPNSHIAALVTSFGTGRVGVVGPHPEATPEWYTAAGLTRPERTATDLAHVLIEEALRRHIPGGCR